MCGKAVPRPTAVNSSSRSSLCKLTTTYSGGDLIWVGFQVHETLRSTPVSQEELTLRYYSSVYTYGECQNVKGLWT
jgi:hypothetical protein